MTLITLFEALSNLRLTGIFVGLSSTGIFLNSLRAKTVIFAPVSYNQCVVTPLMDWTLIKGRGTFVLEKFDLDLFSANFHEQILFIKSAFRLFLRKFLSSSHGLSTQLSLGAAGELFNSLKTGKCQKYPDFDIPLGMGGIDDHQRHLFGFH